MHRHDPDIGRKGSKRSDGLLPSLQWPQTSENTPTAGECRPTESEVVEVCGGDVIASQENRKPLRDHASDDVAQKMIVDDDDAHVVASSGSSVDETKAA